MSHIVTLETRLHDPVALAAACQRLGLPAPTQGTAQLFSGEATGLVVQLPDWQYPVVIDPLTGLVRYDNYGGHWGDQQHIDRLIQRYAVEKAKLEARRRGYPATDQARKDGSTKVQLLEAYPRSPPRRRLVRPPPTPQPPRPPPTRQAQKLQARLEAERTALARWLSKLRRAFHEFDKR